MLCTKLESRSKSFQRGLDLAEVVRKREDSQIELRKQKRHEQVAKKRALLSKASIPGDEESGKFELDSHLIDAELSDLRPVLHDTSATVAERISALIELLKAGSASASPHPVHSLKRVLAASGSPPLSYIASQGVIPPLVSLLSSVDDGVVLSACWSLTNLTAGSSNIVGRVVECGGLTQLVELLRHHDQEVVELAIWAISNIAGDSVERRDLVIRLGVADIVFSLLSDPRPRAPSQLETMLWLLSNLCRGQPSPPLSLSHQVLLSAPFFLTNSNPSLVATMAWALAYITQSGSPAFLHKLMNLGVAPTLVGLLTCDKDTVIIPTLRVVGNVLAGDDDLTQSFLDLGLIERLTPLLTGNKREVRKEALWCFTSITAGTEAQVSAVVSHPCLPLIVAAMRESEFEVKKEAVWAVANLTHYLDTPLLRLLLNLSVFDMMVRALDHQDAGILVVALDALARMMQAAGHELIHRFDSMGAISRLEDLQTHPNTAITAKSNAILSEFFSFSDPQPSPMDIQSAPTEGFQFS